MGKEVERWMRMAKDDLDSAKGNFKIRKYYVSVYLAQQAVEKALKALLIKKTKRLIKIHDLVILGKNTEMPKDLLNKCEQLSAIFIETKSGSIGGPIPSEKFNKDNSYDYLEIAKEVLIWVEKNI